MAITQEQLNRILGKQSVVQRAFNENRPTVTNTPRSIVSGTYADLLKPLTNNLVGDIVLGDVQRGLESASYNQPLTKGGSVQTGGFRPEYLALALGLTPMGKGKKAAEGFSELAASGKIVQAKNRTQEIDDLVKGKSKFAEVKLNWDDPKSYDLADKLEKQGFMSTVIDQGRDQVTLFHKKPEDIASIVNAKTPYDYGKAYGYSEADVANFYKQRYGKEAEQYFQQDKKFTPKKTEYEVAQETAQRNASLPVSEGGLGLPKTNTAMDRAKAMGFDTGKTWYHGTDATNFNSFNPMTYLSESPSEASAYAFVDNLINKEKALSKYKVNPSTKGNKTFVPYSGILSDFTSPEVGKLYATDNGVFKYGGNGKWDAMSKLNVDYDNYNPSTDSMKIVKSNKGEALNAVNENISFANENFSRGVGGRVLPLMTSASNPIELGAYDANMFGKRLGATDSQISDALSKYKNQGYDSINTLSDAASFFPEARELMGGIPKQKIIFNPNQLRSPNAAFDPFRRNEADILAGVGVGIPTAGLLDEKKKPTKK